MYRLCHQKKTKKKRGLVSKPILHSAKMRSECQVGLIDFKTQPSNKIYPAYARVTTFQSKEEIEVYNSNDIFITIRAQ